MQILLADDHVMVREGLCLFLDAQSDMKVVGQAGDGEEAYKKARELRPDVVLMDDSLPHLNGYQATERIITSCPTTKVLAIAAYEDETRVRQFLAAGAAGYVLKKASCQELLRAIRLVSQGQGKGELYLDPAIAGRVMNGFLQPATGKMGRDQFSARETEVLMGVAWGYTNREIAANLHLSVKTIEGHKARIGAKAGLTNRAQMMRHALQRGWIADE